MSCEQNGQQGLGEQHSFLYLITDTLATTTTEISYSEGWKRQTHIATKQSHYMLKPNGINSIILILQPLDILLAFKMFPIRLLQSLKYEVNQEDIMSTNY